MKLYNIVGVTSYQTPHKTYMFAKNMMILKRNYPGIIRILVEVVQDKLFNTAHCQEVDICI